MRRLISASTVGLLLLTTNPAAAVDNVVLQWNETLLQAVRNVRFAPMYTARALAIVHTAMFDAWAPYDDFAVGAQFRAMRRPVGERADANKRMAISYAAYRTLIDLFPGEALLIDARMDDLGYDVSDDSLLGDSPASIGNACALAILGTRHQDGANQLDGYADTSGYVPVNTPVQVFDPNRWQPLINPNGTTQAFLAAHWERVMPFALSSADEFRPNPPPLYPHGTYRKEANQILHFSANLTDRQKMIAAYFADGPSTETPPGHWNLFAQFVSRRDGHSLDDDVKMFFALGNALLDASIAVWEAKVRYDFARPVTAIHFLYAGKPVRAWGGAGNGTQLISGEEFRSYIATPPFAEYVSGHSAFSAASAEILKSFTGSDAFGASVTFAAGSSPIEPATVPAAPLTLAWRTFSEAADEAGISRRYGGIHFESGDLEARALGRKIAAKVWNKVQGYFDGTAP